MATGGDEPQDTFLELFSAAEAASEEVIENILTEGGRQLHESYIEKKSFSFAAETVSQILVAELKMCFVRHDPGENTAPTDPADSSISEPWTSHSAVTQDPFNSWTLEPEPDCSRVDTWARSCVPIRRKFVQPKAEPIVEQSRRRTRPKLLSSSSIQSPSRTGMSNASGVVTSVAAAEQQDLRGQATARSSQMIPLVEEREEDVEETALREMKEREERRKREEDIRIRHKEAEEAEEAAQLATVIATVKEQMKNKPYTYDSNGNIIWVQPANVKRLPPTSAVPAYSVRKTATQQRDGTLSPRPQQGNNARTGKKRATSATKRREPNFTDTFEKFAAQQPSPMETMTVAPGVELSEKGYIKKGVEVLAKRGAAATMSRKEYLETVQGGLGGFRPASAEDDAEDLTKQVSRKDNSKQVLRGHSLRVDSSDDIAGAGSLKPEPPISHKPIPPAAPPTFRRVQLKRDALGYQASTRERVATGTASRYPNCAAQPPLGATMGHGLVPAGHKTEEYFFPNAHASNVVSTIMDDGVSVSSALPSQRGQIVSQNPELTKRWFPR
mmetsp:Transcript_81151/g.160882  ORF Transcript_81151/g.160882 Transcript_81151/m.160882 type:complete len:556 (+) Transcript_81151:48-1715(+)|eukprot:CAMPEP_0172701360 /NCGR_PEP_ID=MMETSP1074-20121228/31583_1 /TAXON_ID=2916 /ORGANISM="Ceratium fusus, Strain PA161109" /LENGTH=555 /DNA_ID=CAMNT_0013522901 /DNA_START=51 /DNA_END=1718 /DNA_ORIENTATION=-